MDAVVSKSPVTPFSLKDAPSLIERIWPVQKLSAEAQKERLGAQTQTLTPLGSYWKGRKPLILVRACVLASLLPSTGDDEKDLDLLETLIGLSDQQVLARRRDSLSIEEVAKWAPPSVYASLVEESIHDEKLFRVFRKSISREERDELMAQAISNMPYIERVEKLARPEEVNEGELIAPYLDKVNRTYHTTARSLAELIQQLGIMRFGRVARVGDTFAGGGSIPFEAARLGCDAFASDLNPIACMLTWGSFNIVGAAESERLKFESAQRDLMAKVDAELTKLGVEHDKHGNRAKAYLYCLEVTCPHTGWKVPLAPTWVISKVRRIVGKLVPDPDNKRFHIDVIANASDGDFHEAEKGTLRGGSVIYRLDGTEYRTSLKSIRGDVSGKGVSGQNRLRRWEKSDITFRANDVFTERLYAIQWITHDSLRKGRQTTFFAASSEEDRESERKVQSYVKDRLGEWQATGFIPNMPIEPGEETNRLSRERGWTYWHHLFSPRELLIFGLMRKFASGSPFETVAYLFIARSLDWNSRLCSWRGSAGKEANAHVFINQALNTIVNTVSRGFCSYGGLMIDTSKDRPITGNTQIANVSAEALRDECELFITDPPYADAVHYHEITEYFIAWLRKNPPHPFDEWTWDSRRPLAIRGDGEDFRKGMVDAYKTMADHMPDNGLQIVMFTHQDAGVWGDMAQIFWGAGLRVMAAWYIATETTSELKKGGYVQGTVILVLRKRKGGEHGYKDEVVQEVKFEVAEQIDTMSGLNQSLKGHGRVENLFEDADLQMAGYAAALRVLTKYTTIDGVDMTKEALRPRVKGERGLVGEIIEFAVQVANEHMSPEGMSPKIWEQLTGSERFLFKMMDIETTGAKKLDNYQNFAKAFRVAKYDDLLGSMVPNEARLKSAKEFKKAGFEGSEFGASKSRALLFAIYELQNEIDGDDVLSHLRDLVPDYFNVRDDLAALADYVAKKRANIDEPEARAAAILHGLIRNERFG
jgi:adenine-specific DNA methylase